MSERWQLSVERRYSARERAGVTQGELERCNTLVGAGEAVFDDNDWGCRWEPRYLGFK